MQLFNVLKGFLIGFSDIIPGVSGGTIALIVGVYERLISALGNINLQWLSWLGRYAGYRRRRALQQAQKEFMRMDPVFMLLLGLGVGVAVLAGSFLVPYLLGAYPVYTYAVFFGLIAASVVLITREHLRSLTLIHGGLGLLGCGLGFWIGGLSAGGVAPSLPVLFGSGFMAISAMLLPGVSGAFMLLLFGQYEYVLSALHAPFTHLVELSVFALGVVAGVLVVTRLIAMLLRRYHEATLFFLAGLMAGSLRLLASRMLFVEEFFPEVAFSWTAGSAVLVLLLAAAGAAAISVIQQYGAGKRIGH